MSQKRKVTEQDLIENPELAQEGVKVGDEIEIPEGEEQTENENADQEKADTGGSAPPPNKDRG